MANRKKSISYDGSDLSCSQCKNSYHLECINLKRQPRYNFVCKECKPSAEGSRKRKIRANDSSSESENDEYEEDETPPLLLLASLILVAKKPNDDCLPLSCGKLVID
uniref:Histone-lysine N-methyltransferase NSD-like PHD zinc finger 1 domain-containing protein n=1 Tax=Glossina morsitans morsitans TaxID=37546 RepID=A0A1B0FG40_GLOMM